MLYIYTDKTNIPAQKQYIHDIESQYTLKRQDIIAKYENSPLALKVLQEIEGMTYHDGDMIKAKFGAVALDNISTGGKGCLLMALYHEEITLSTDEIGYNGIDVLCAMSKEFDVSIYSSAPYTYLPENIDGFINDEFYNGGENILDAMEAYYG